MQRKNSKEEREADFLKDIVCRILKDERVKVTVEFPPNFEEIVKSECFRALCDIRDILDDYELPDEECFMKIEKIVCLFESLGSNCGSRHDFG